MMGRIPTTWCGNATHRFCPKPFAIKERHLGSSPDFESGCNMKSCIFTVLHTLTEPPYAVLEGTRGYFGNLRRAVEHQSLQPGLSYMTYGLLVMTGSRDNGSRSSLSSQPTLLDPCSFPLPPHNLLFPHLFYLGAPPILLGWRLLRAVIWTV